MSALSYEEWYKRSGKPVFFGTNCLWKIYQRALIPLSPFPVFPEIDRIEERRLLKESKAIFLRYTPPVYKEETITNFWYVTSAHYSMDDLSSNTRNKIRRGHKNCEVIRVSLEWLSENTFECFERYSKVW